MEMVKAAAWKRGVRPTRAKAALGQHGPKRRRAAALVRLKAQVVGEVKVLFR
jgi:hypothetical protein